MEGSAPDLLTKVSTGLVEGITTIANGMGDFIASALPVILPIVGAVTVIGFGIKLFRRFAK